MFCQRCGTRNLEADRFCGNCGAPLAPSPSGTGPPQGLYNVVLTRVGTRKIDVIKVVREVTGLSLADAKTLVESAPAVIKSNLSAPGASQLQQQLEHVQASARIEPGA